MVTQVGFRREANKGCINSFAALCIVYIEGPPGPAGPKGEPGIPASATTGDGSSSLVTVVTDIEDLQQATLKHTEGTLAFVLSEQTLLVRNKNGWQYLTVGRTLAQPLGP